MKRSTILLSLLAISILILAACAAPASTAGTSALISPASYVDQFGADQSFDEHILLDVRTPEEFANGHIPGAININVEELSTRMSEIPSDLPVVVYCRSGNRSATAAAMLSGQGYTVYDLGGIIDWQAAGLPVSQ
jgi:rhodanese-related sulfurtransferase